MAMESIIRASVNLMLKVKDPTTNENKFIFTTFQEAIEYLKKNKELQSIAQGKIRQWELGIGVAIICGLLVNYRESLSEKLGTSLLLSGLG